MLRLAVAAAAASATLAGPSPTYHQDYAGLDYNVTDWNSPPGNAPNHWIASALDCEALCLADANCCTWTYVTPGKSTRCPALARARTPRAHQLRGRRGRLRGPRALLPQERRA